MEVVVTMKEDYEIRFWKDWLEADRVKRLKLVKQLSIVKEIKNINELPEKYREEFFVSHLNSFFEDLESAMHTEARLEKRKNK